EWEVRDRAVENTGYNNLVFEALNDALVTNGYDSVNAAEVMGDNYYDAVIDLNKLEQDLRKAEIFENADGEIATSQVIADMFKNLGFDGIILTDVSERFKNMGLSESMSHVHVFDEFNNQIKLADGSNVTFGETSDIRFSTTGDILQSDVYNPSPTETYEQYRERFIEEVSAIVLQENSQEYYESIAKENGLNEEQTSSFISKIKEFLNDFVEWLSNQLGLTNITPQQLAEMTNKEMFDAI